MALLQDIEAFMERARVSATALGQQALGDRHFVRQLRNGRRVWPETEQKVREFMAAFDHAQVDSAKSEHPSTGQIRSLPGHLAAPAPFGAAEVGERGTRVALPDGGRA